ncbi:MAG: FAD-dependent oxidoreductase [Dehalococcoidales bacterium]|nr:FAD-dependent oxidoreductase [Dehalococcoidales bacterium]
MKFTRLMEPGKIGKLEIKNRIVMAAMGTGMAGLWGEVTDNLIEWYRARAKGGAGLIMTGACQTATAIDQLRLAQPQLRMDDDKHVAGMRELVEVVHQAGAKAGIQLSSGMGAQARGGSWLVGRAYVDDIPAVAPSAVESPEVKKRVRALSVAEIEKIIELFGLAAGRARTAGFDAIEIHGHAGHLIAEFMTPLFNKRTDKYGGDFKGRMRFLTELVAAARKNAGADMPLILKYSIGEYIEGGRSIEDGLEIARYAQGLGVDAICVSAGVWGSKVPAIPTLYHPVATYVGLAEALKQVVQIPVILPGSLGDPALAEKVLAEGKADFIGMGRPLTADPELPRKIKQGNIDQIRRCIRCNDCHNSLSTGIGPIRCAINPVAGRERRWGTLQPAEKAKKVFIAGAGPAGMEAARIAALRGHRVTLFEKGKSLGCGQLELASQPPHKAHYRDIAEYYVTALGQMKNVRIELGKALTAAIVTSQKPDVVIIATGGTPIVPDIPGVKGKNVVSAFDVLQGKANVGKNVIVAGGGLIGCETANLIAGQGKKVTIVEMLPTISAAIGRWTLAALQSELDDCGVKILTGTRIEAVTPKGVTVSSKGKKSELKADTIVLALGVRPDNKLAGRLEGKVPELYTIGDARKPGRIMDATSDGFFTAYDI